MSKIPTDVINDILLNLPVKSLVRFQCLSKPICSLIEGPDFVNRHLSFSLRTRSNFSLILRDWQLHTVDLDSLDVPGSVAPVESLVHPLHIGGGTEAVGSCNGLIALRNSERDVALFNPSTRQFKRVPVSEIDPPDRSLKYGYVFYAFGYDSVNEDYKLIRMATFTGEDERCESFNFDYEVKVYSLNNDSWKRIKKLPTFLRLLHKPFYQVLHRRGYGTYACNAFHWAFPQWPELGVRNSVVSFDIVNETFHEVPQPDYGRNRFNTQVDVGSLEGKLCLMCNHGHEYVELWVMDKYGIKDSWNKLLTFCPTKSINAFMFLRPLAYSKDGDRLLLEVNDHKLVWYDLIKKTVRTVKIRDAPKSFGAELCVGSLISLRGGIGMDEERIQKELRKEREKEEMINSKKRDDFLSVGFKLKL